MSADAHWGRQQHGAAGCDPQLVQHCFKFKTNQLHTFYFIHLFFATTVKHVLLWSRCEAVLSLWDSFHIREQKPSRNREIIIRGIRNKHKCLTFKRKAMVSCHADEHPARIDDVCSRDSPWLPLTHQRRNTYIDGNASSVHWGEMSARIYSLQASLKDIQSSLLNVGCLFPFCCAFCQSFSVFFYPGTVLLHWQWSWDHCHPEKWSCCQSGHPWTASHSCTQNNPK